MTLDQAYILAEEEETKKRRNKEFSKTIEDNYSKTFVKNIERIVNKKFCGDLIKRIEITPALNTITNIKIIDKNGKEIEDSKIKEKIMNFYKLKKKAFDSNSDYYFKERPPANQKIALLRRSIGEEIEES